MKSPDIPFLELKRLNEHHHPEFMAALQAMLDRGWYLLGEETAAFEAEFAAYCDCSYAVSVANGLDALRLTLQALEIGSGDEVIVPAHTFIATALAVSDTGATVRLADIDPDTFCLATGSVQKAVTAKTKAVIAVHLYGYVQDFSELKSFCKDKGIYLIEDAAQAHGARDTVTGERAGSIGDAAAFSFYPGKNLGALGDGGAVTTANAGLQQKILQLRNYGSTQKYQHECKGINSRLDEIQAAFLRIKLRELDAMNAKRRAVATYYNSTIRNDQIELPRCTGDESHVWHLYVIKTAERERLTKHLTQASIGYQIHYPRTIAQHKAYKNELFDDCPVAEKVVEQIVSLPLHPALTDQQQRRIVEALNEYPA